MDAEVVPRRSATIVIATGSCRYGGAESGVPAQILATPGDRSKAQARHAPPHTDDLESHEGIFGLSARCVIDWMVRHMVATSGDDPKPAGVKVAQRISIALHRASASDLEAVGSLVVERFGIVTRPRLSLAALPCSPSPVVPRRSLPFRFVVVVLPRSALLSYLGGGFSLLGVPSSAAFPPPSEDAFREVRPRSIGQKTRFKRARVARALPFVEFLHVGALRGLVPRAPRFRSRSRTSRLHFTLVCHTPAGTHMGTTMTEFSLQRR